MKYELFLFDLDDTLLDFKASEELSFVHAMQSLGLQNELQALYNEYRIENRALWSLFEQGLTTKEHLKVERFRRIFSKFKIEVNPEIAAHRYLEALPETVVLIDHSLEVCQWIKDQQARIGIITNGIHHVQTQRIAKSSIAPFIDFVCVSEECGFAKPDVRFFKHAAERAQTFSKETALVIGDRLETDIQGALNFGLDSCWFNPEGLQHPDELKPHFNIQHLSELPKTLRLK